MKPSEVFLKSLSIRDSLKKNNDWAVNPIDDSLNPIPPYKVSDEIKLIILGQDPTIKNVSRRKNIKTTLNLDKKGALLNYITHICTGLGISIENIYATNIFKYFYSIPPAGTMSVLHDHLAPNLHLLLREIHQYGQVPIITLGQPILKLLTNSLEEVKYYWDYDMRIKLVKSKFNYCEAPYNKLDRDFFPFPHQPSLRKDFYKDTLDDYIMFVKNKSSIK